MMKALPPIEHTPGSVTRETRTAATAASTALPPSSAIRAPASAAIREVEEIPTLCTGRSPGLRAAAACTPRAAAARPRKVALYHGFRRDYDSPS